MTQRDSITSLSPGWWWSQQPWRCSENTLFLQNLRGKSVLDVHRLLVCTSTDGKQKINSLFCLACMCWLWFKYETFFISTQELVPTLLGKASEVLGDWAVKPERISCGSSVIKATDSRAAPWVPLVPQGKQCRTKSRIHLSWIFQQCKQIYSKLGRIPACKMVQCFFSEIYLKLQITDLGKTHWNEAAAASAPISWKTGRWSLSCFFDFRWVIWER